MENHSTPLAAQISEARAAKQHLESGGVGPCKVHPHVSPLQEIVLNAVLFKESDAVVAYPDNAIQEARKMQAASEKPYKELCMQLQSELKSVRFQKKFLVRKDVEDETQDYKLTVLRGDEIPSMEKLESLVILGQAMERLAAAETLSELQLDKKQHQALIKAATNQVLILTGAAGCGKTYATYAIVTYFRSLGMAMHLMAPTGRAASNMRSMTGEDASTIHSALRATPLYVKMESAHENV
ncbi:hypothetical protein DUNSADRAFT_13040 [Dunaliella salina]|uniref:ATP-dependent DNA helicase n=1 Tax=Dunaliella salina TaxID=3046 RepID=A0ABQ7GA47_DUNSA|nr:hypothetical protein DUNSADRAFT_13040 [Dunaliella salina]|eukprot:KAF5831482.1 hypothetical protein DUNSADRAFT_13040 [Dunaliella salina]